jgi:hypothetical protein
VINYVRVWCLRWASKLSSHISHALFSILIIIRHSYEQREMCRRLVTRWKSALLLAVFSPLKRSSSLWPKNIWWNNKRFPTRKCLRRLWALLCRKGNFLRSIGYKAKQKNISWRTFSFHMYHPCYFKCDLAAVELWTWRIVWDITPSRSSKVNRCFGATCRLHLQGRSE